MDELGSLILGESPKAKASSYEISDQLLDSLKRVESGGNPKAVNSKSGAMGAYQFMPATVESMRKQGIEFDPFNEKEARAAAKSYLEKLTKQHGGDVSKALAAYGGFVTKDPTAYVENVLQGSNKSFGGDELGSLILGKTPAPAKPQVAPQVQQTQQTAPQAPEAGGTAVGRAMAGMLQKQQEKKKEIPGLLASAADVIAGAPSAISGTIGYGAGRLFGLSDKEATAASQKVAQPLAQPVGKLTGLAETQAYKQALPTQIMDYIGKHIGEGAQSIAQKFGVPVADVENAINAVAMVAPIGIAKGKKAITSAAAELKNITPDQLQAQFQAAKAPAGSTGAAKVENNPYAGQITGEEGARGQFPQIKLSKITKDVAPNEQAVRSQAIQEVMPGQQVRPGVITGNENTLRNEYTKAKMDTPEGQLYKQQIAKEQNALSDYAQERVRNTSASETLVTPYERGQRINDAFTGEEGLTGFIKGEKKALYDEAKNRTGDNPIKTDNVEKLLGNEQFKAGLGLKGNESVAGSAEKLINLAKTVGFEDEMGTFHPPNTVSAWTAVQKSLNNNWTPQNASVIRRINQAIERDIGEAGGLDLLKKADSLHQAEKVLFGSKGIKQIFGDIDPNGVQTATAFDAIPQKLNSMPLDQWKHIYDTAERVSSGKLTGPIDKATGEPKWTIDVPEELRVSAQSAMNEMRGNIAREIYQAGASKVGEWNQNAVNKILNARADKIKLAFSPEEQKAFHTLNTVGHLMPGVHGYEGAGLQARRVGMIEGNLGKIGTTLGAGAGTAIFGPGAGTAIGGYVGGKAGIAGSEAMATRTLNKQAVKAQKQMEKAAKIGTKLQDIGK
jgi:hypothetical protein